VGDMVLAGIGAIDQPNPGPTVCSCFGIGVNSILDTIQTHGLMSVEAIGDALGAGTNCGACKPELNALLKRCSPIELAT